MAVKKIKAIANSSRNTILIDYSKSLSKDEDLKKKERKLRVILKKNSGRDKHSGQITTRHQGGRNKRFYRIIDFKRNKNDYIEGIIKSIEYDPNRNCFISLIHYLNGDKTYILSPDGVKVGDRIMSGCTEEVPIKVGNNLPLDLIPINTIIHNLELQPGKGGQLLRSAGVFGEIIGKEKDSRYVLIKLKSKEVRKILSSCRATIGKVGNSEANLVKLGKAGRNNWRGKRPTVRGSAMNPKDHPHGGGEGKCGIGRKSPMDPWGNKTLGVKTRRKNKPSNKRIVRTRHESKK